MAKLPAVTGLVAGCLLAVGAGPALAQPSAEQMLKFTPKQKDVAVSTPTTADELRNCEVKLVQGTQPGSSGWLLSDAKKQPLRRFLGSKGSKGGVDTWCYFKDGVEVYREVDSNGNGSADQFRWLNSAGMKWGVDVNEDGAIDAWRMISAEEVGYEAFQAVAQNDFNRLKALFPTARELEALKLPAGEVARITAGQKQAQGKFGDLVKALPNLTGARFERVEAVAPSCVPAEALGGDVDLIKYASRPILYEGGDKKHDWLHTGEMVQVGLAWRLVDVPSTTDPASGGATAPGNDVAKTDPRVRDLLEKLTKLDEDVQRYVGEPATSAKLRDALTTRISLVQQIVAVVDAKERETWYRQIFDNLSTLAQANDAGALKNLTDLRDQVVKGMPTSELAPYGTYREMWTRYVLANSPEAAKKGELEKVQAAWVEQLSKFVQTYPRAEDTADALHHLAIHAEYTGKDDEAKRWYAQVYTNFPKHSLAEKCKGADVRLSLPGKQLELAGPQLKGGAAFNVDQLKGKAVIVYYWASTCNECVGDFARLKKAYDDQAGKLELVFVNLDDNAEQANAYLKNAPTVGVHLFQAAPQNMGGMNSPLALQYGINGLPTVFLVGRDGRVLNRALHIGDLESELKKALQ